MELWLKIVLVLGAYIFMEGFAWFMHKYVMHGFLWAWHKSHHTDHGQALELNDLFVFFFAVPPAVCIYSGLRWPELAPLLYIGIGISGYGLTYFIFHDVIVHQRIPLRFTTRWRYMRRIIKAHHIHHARRVKEGCESFGFLYAPPKYEKANRRGKIRAH